MKDLTTRLNAEISKSLSDRTVKELFIAAAFAEMILNYFNTYHAELKKQLPKIDAQQLTSAQEWKAMTNTQRRKVEKYIATDKNNILSSVAHIQATLTRLADSIASDSTKSLNTVYELQDILVDVCEKFFKEGGEAQ